MDSEREEEPQTEQVSPMSTSEITVHEFESPRPGPSERHPPPARVVTGIIQVRNGSSEGEDPDSETTSSGQVEEKKRRRRRSAGIHDSSPGNLRSFDGLTRRQLLNLAVLALTDFIGAVLLTNQNPWFPIQVRVQHKMQYVVSSFD